MIAFGIARFFKLVNFNATCLRNRTKLEHPKSRPILRWKTARFPNGLRGQFLRERFLLTRRRNYIPNVPAETTSPKTRNYVKVKGTTSKPEIGFDVFVRNIIRLLGG